MLLGLLAYQSVRWWVEPAAPIPVEPPAALRAPPDPWAESRRSRAILAAQEGAPAPAPIGRERRAERIARTGAIRVIDGDTFVLAGETIRIADIDTPETHPPRCAREAELGARATRRLAVLLAAGPFELVPIDRDADRYGRKLRIVRRDGRPIGDTLVAEGLARPYGAGRRSWCA